MKIPRNVLILFFVFLLLVLVLGVLYYKQDEESYMPQPKPNLPTGTYALSMVVVDASNQNTNKLVTVSTDGNVVINPTIGPINRASQSGRNNITTPRTQSGFTNQRQNVWSNMYSWWFPSTKEGFATITTSPATTTTSPATTTTSPATTTTNPSMTRAAYTGGPTSFATISTFNIECFNVNADKWQSAAAQSAAAQSAATQSAATQSAAAQSAAAQSAATTPGTTTTSAATTSATSAATKTPLTTVPAFTVAPNSYMVSTTITFNIAGIGFATYDIWMNNGSNNSNIADSTSSFTCVTGSCSTCSILPNCQGIQVITASPVSTSNPTVSNPTPTGSNPTPTGSSPSPTGTNPTPTGSNYTNIRQMITSVEVTLNQNLYYTVWLILYDINGNIVAASCPNTIIQIVPSMINNPAAYLNYTFSSSYLLIGGGGGGGQGGTGGG